MEWDDVYHLSLAFVSFYSNMSRRSLSREVVVKKKNKKNNKKKQKKKTTFPCCVECLEHRAMPLY